MKKLFLIALFMAVSCELASAQFFTGIKTGTDVGIEAGFIIARRFSLKAYSFTDYTSTFQFFSNNKTEPNEGNRYILSYGLGIGANVGGPFWLYLDAGFGWVGQHTTDPVYDTKARKNNVQGVEIGMEVQWDFTETAYLSAGYYTLPIGFSVGRPVHCALGTIGIRF